MNGALTFSEFFYFYVRHCTRWNSCLISCPLSEGGVGWLDDDGVSRLGERDRGNVCDNVGLVCGSSQAA
jgi:hypothetical protein